MQSTVKSSDVVDVNVSLAFANDIIIIRNWLINSRDNDV